MPQRPDETRTPLAAWRFDGTLRHYQADVLERVDVHAKDPLHIVAPPGSGKTLLGLLLAARRGMRAVVLAPTVTIRAQWAQAAASLIPSHIPSAGTVSEDPATPGDLTVLTYQALSVLDAANPLETLARARWGDELQDAGRSPEASAAWLDDLRVGNPSAYRRGIARRSRALRRRLVRENPDTLAAALHPNARALIDRLVAHGVDTIVLDECHHLLDHWALVVATLVARLRADGRHPLVIGLTATLPSPDDADEYENYTSLLGDVDYEVPTPAVVREGNLAPYRDLVRFVDPTAQELAFLRAHAEGLAVLIRSTFADGAGLQFLVDTLQPTVDPEEEKATDAAPPSREPPSSSLDPPAATTQAPLGVLPVPLPPAPGLAAVDARLAVAFAADFAGAEAAASMLATVAPRHPLVVALPFIARRPPTSDEALRLLARYALDHVLRDPERTAQWERIRRTLADFGYALSDRGVRRTRDPVDTILASSLAKDHAACDILRIERAQLGDDRLRALVVTDFARHGNTHGGLIDSAGALRTFDVIVTDAGTRRLRPVLVTGSAVRIAARDAEAFVPALSEALGAPVAALPATGSGVCEVRAPGVGVGAIVGAVAALLTRGDLHVVVGTRGLFGEGWDCPAVNTLIDLTAVSTASATQQLRGRTLRLDPAWPEKVAHNWTVTALLPPELPLDAAPDVSRLRRKHARLWGLDVEEPSRIVRGLGIALGAEQQAALRAVVRKEESASVAALNALTQLDPRDLTRARWRVGEDYLDREQVSAVVLRRPAAAVFRTSRPARAAVSRAVALAVLAGAGGLAFAVLSGAALGAIAGVAVAAAAGWAVGSLAGARRHLGRQAAHATDTYRRIAGVVWETLRQAGRVTDVPAPSFVVTEGAPQAGAVALSVECPDASLHDQATLSRSLTELFGPVRTPRFLLQTGQGGSRLVAAVLRRAGRRDERGDGHHLPVPAAIGRRREDALAFGRRWRDEVGPCLVHEVADPGALVLVAQARRGGDGLPGPVAREEWI